MGKIIFYIPTILFTILFGLMSFIFGVDSVSPIVIAWIVLFLMSGFLLSRNKYGGSLIGILPGIHWIYMSLKDTGQTINIELPLGIFVLLYYAICTYYIYKNKSVKSNP